MRGAGSGDYLTKIVGYVRRHPFLLGVRPCVADFTLSGGFQAHFAYDPWPRRLVEERAPEALAYAERCWNARADEARWPTDDRLPST